MKYEVVFDRLNTLLQLLSEQPEANLDWLVETLNVSRATLQRDVQKLQSLGYDIDYCRKNRTYVLSDEKTR